MKLRKKNKEVPTRNIWKFRQATRETPLPHPPWQGRIYMSWVYTLFIAINLWQINRLVTDAYSFSCWGLAQIILKPLQYMIGLAWAGFQQFQ